MHQVSAITEPQPDEGRIVVRTASKINDFKFYLHISTKTQPYKISSRTHHTGRRGKNMRLGLQEGDLPVHRLKDEDFLEDEKEGREGDEEENPFISSPRKDTENLQHTSIKMASDVGRSNRCSWRFITLCGFMTAFVIVALCALAESGPQSIAMRHTIPLLKAAQHAAGGGRQQPEKFIKPPNQGRKRPNRQAAKGASEGWAGQAVHRGASGKAMSIAAEGAELPQEGNAHERVPKSVRASLKATASVRTVTRIGRRSKKDGMKQLPMEGVPEGSISTGTSPRHKERSDHMLEKPKPSKSISTGAEDAQGSAPAPAAMDSSDNESGKKSAFWKNCKASENMQCFMNKQTMYAVSSEKATWKAAEARCQELSPRSHLVTIENENQNRYVASKVKDKIGFWIGLRFEEGDWQWVSGTPLTFENWHTPKGERPVRGPEMLGDQGPQHCASSNFHAAKTYSHHEAPLGLWDNEYCPDVVPDRIKPFVCSISEA